jgi:prolyl oligopeptidase
MIDKFRSLGLWCLSSSIILVFLFVLIPLGKLMAETPAEAPIQNVTDTYHGVSITDPYRYMEDFTSPLVQDWVKKQATFAKQTLDALPGRDTLLERIIELDAGRPFTIFDVQRHSHENLFYFKQLATENVAKVYYRDHRTGEERLLLDPETFPKANAADHFTISFFRVSPNGAYLLYAFAASGSEETTLKVFDLDHNQDLPDTIDRLESEYAKPCWLPDSRGFMYSRRRKLAAHAPPADGYKYTQAFRHTIGQPVDHDKLLFANSTARSPEMAEMDFPAIVLTSGSSWAIGQVKHGDETDLTLYAAPLAALGTDHITWMNICDRSQQVTDFAVKGDDIYLLTAENAPRYKIVCTSLAKPDFTTAATILAAGDYVVRALAVAKDALYVQRLEGVVSKLDRIPFENNASTETLALPAAEPSGSIADADPEIRGILISTQSWTRCSRLYRYDPAANAIIDTCLLPAGKFDAPPEITATEVMIPSHDGVQVPLSIIHRRDIQLNGTNPTLISGYGAYGAISPMRFDPTRLAWLERGGVLAIAHVRGGGVFGKAWHHAGRKATKPNTWKDFIACTEHLVKAGYTAPRNVAGQGGSAGGILIGRAITERPDLYAAAQIAVGCTDMLRFETTMNGPPNIPEFGTVTRENEFRSLLAMSAFHHIHEGTKYPAVVLTHGINDPRVEPWESAKTTARLQASTASGKPVLFRVDYHSGHGIGSTKRQRFEELADVWAFCLWQFGAPDFQPK